MAKTIPWFALALLLTTVCLGSSPPQAPVPPDIKIESPDLALPAEVKSLVGKWTGRLETRWGVGSALYVEKIDKDSAQVVISWGEYSHAFCHCESNWVRVKRAKLRYSGGKAALEFYAPMQLGAAQLVTAHTVSGENKAGARYSYTFAASEPNSLKGSFITPRMSKPVRIRMQKVE